MTVTPLVEPNALMLIGRKENIPAVVELIQKLDQPTAADSQFKVFQLKHMSAIDAERTRASSSSSTGRATRPDTAATGLGTRVLGDRRVPGNALIVQASPRDMAEVDAADRKLDIDDTPAHRTRCGSSSSRTRWPRQLAPALQEAITGVGGAGRQQQQQQQPQQGGQGRAAPRRRMATRRATSLQFLRIDADGQRAHPVGRARRHADHGRHAAATR